MKSESVRLFPDNVFCEIEMNENQFVALGERIINSLLVGYNSCTTVESIFLFFISTLF